jgi:hypothetical protein
MSKSTNWITATAMVVAIAGAGVGLWLHHLKVQREAVRAAFAAYEERRTRRFTAESKAAIDEFHRRFNDRKLDEIYDNSAFWNPPKHELWLNVMRQMRDRLGPFQRVKSSKINCPEDQNNFCEASYVSDFEKSEAAEQFYIWSWDKIRAVLITAEVKSEPLQSSDRSQASSFKFPD